MPLANAAASSQSFGKWQISPAPSGEESLSLSLRAEKAVKGWMKSATPTLTIECRNKKAAVYVETWLPLEVTQVDKQIVRVQFDNGKPIPQRWQEITNAAMGASTRDSILLVKQLAKSQKFVFEFTPFNSPPVQAEFDVAGLAAYLPQLGRMCWE
ncbi:MAG: hypothetical protein HZC43_04220 [Nitrosomonadales bacterium]|nr:hypothetical protein [Nitrosomonadales bacterium]